MSEPKISIITVCKNAENAIERTMLSVVTQSCFAENIEYLIIDGASTDKTIEIIKQYSDKYPIKWISEPDSGIYNAMNKGIKLASGDYLLFLNAGDYLVHYNVIKSLIDLFGNCEYDVLHGNAFFIDPVSEKYYIKMVDEPLDAYFFYQNALPHQATFYKRELFDKFGGYEEKFRVVSDVILNKKFLYDQKVSSKHIDHVISVFTEDGISSRNSELCLKEMKMFQKDYFTKQEITYSKNQIKKNEKIKLRQQDKSLFRFLSKIFMKLHEFWVNR